VWLQRRMIHSSDSRRSVAREFRISLFSRGVIASGQRKLRKWPIRKSEPSQSRRREGPRVPVRIGASLSHWLWAHIIECNCKEVPINPIIQSRTRYYSSRKPLIHDNILQKAKGDQHCMVSIFRALLNNKLKKVWGRKYGWWIIQI
jgi:hypothetical protein